MLLKAATVIKIVVHGLVANMSVGELGVNCRGAINTCAGTSLREPRAKSKGAERAGTS